MKKVKLTLFERRIEKGPMFVPISEEKHNKIREGLRAERERRNLGIAPEDKNRSVNIRLSDNDIAKIREMSGVSESHYKTFMADIIRDYAAGKLVEKDSIK
ncbi:MAG: hypothetical protein LBL39_05665 [Planctomycetaceae bacterium]|jgi:predicted DNA binding CopG/RHH family protein|nr:hypothetical protein [Planctomycetaceae bacterium]